MSRCRCGGKLFHTPGLAALKLRSPKLLKSDHTLYSWSIGGELISIITEAMASELILEWG